MRLPGYALFFAALIMMSGEVGKDLIALKNWNEATTTGFVGNTLIHFGAVGTAWLGGRIIPTGAQKGGMRKTDPK